MSSTVPPITVSRLTPLGRGAVATIRVRADLPGVTNSTGEALFAGLNSLFRSANGIALSDQPLRKIVFGQWGPTDTEDLVVCRIAVNCLEIHCHGGDAAVERVLNDLARAGCVVVDWREQLASSTDRFDSDCRDVLSRTSTWRTAKIVLEQTNGLLRVAFSELGAFESSGRPARASDIDRLLRWARFGLHLSKPWSIVLTGAPNVGKSSLINALLGYHRAIVFDEPGTTRDVVTGETALDGWPVEFADTAGIRDDAGELEAAGIALARQRLQSADLQLVLIDLSQPPTAVDQQLIGQWSDAIVVAHKSDLPDLWGDRLPIRAIRVSSVTGAGVADLQRQIVHRLVPEVPERGTPIPLTQWQIELLQILKR